ncbi:CxC2 domain-containing protein [Mycena indigotica]|uniref:CxC2 domain-containing protein n=1 Tax=Mycena indigotica TaxID=2126181 RepID=A0A8H6S3U6_9AGAR|nr:CxC2 domain-containing protein [Mycena indigotica]KAF7291342.1 CxC2 domain-containing protein [Mycena indigotica]
MPPVLTTVHRLTADNRRVFSETVPIAPTSPVKRARLEHMERQKAAVDLSNADDPERYEMGLEDVEEDFGFETATSRLTQPADKAMHHWAENQRDVYLQALLWREGRGDADQDVCSKCKKVDSAIYRCRTCHDVSLLCGLCCVETHRANPLHHIEQWTGVYFKKTSLRDLGLRIQFSHPLGQKCSLPRPGRPDFVVLADNGFHDVAVDFCGCVANEPHYIQLLKAGWYPSTSDAPRTCATFACLDTFHYQTLHGKTTAYDYYATLESLTDGTGIKPPQRYSSFLRMARQYRHLLLLKRGGRGHDQYGVMGTAPGELAIRCPACPRPGVNLPEGWEQAPPEDRQVRFP